MSELTDRLLILLIAAVALGSILVGWVGGFLVPQFAGLSQTVGMAVLFVFLIVLLIGIWFEFNTIKTEQD